MVLFPKKKIFFFKPRPSSWERIIGKKPAGLFKDCSMKQFL